MFIEQYGIRKGISTENSSFRQADCLEIYEPKKWMWEEFSVILESFFIM